MHNVNFIRNLNNKCSLNSKQKINFIIGEYLSVTLKFTQPSFFDYQYYLIQIFNLIHPMQYLHHNIFYNYNHKIPLHQAKIITHSILLDMKLIILSFILFCISFQTFLEPPYPAWAHSHWVWLNGKIQNQTNLLQMVQTYQSYNISVGALNIDSAWSTGFNNFKWNYTKFPNPKQMIDGLHSQGIRVIAWVTSMINNDSSNYKQGKEKGYFLNNGGIVKWWHGHGSFLDYRNKAAVQWWHRQMDQVLDIGLDGWKTDGTDPIMLLLKPWPYSKKKTNIVTYREYATQYYGDFFNYTRTRNPMGLIMSRPVDNGLQKFYLKYSPKYVMYSGWVGDQDSSFDGLKYALKNVFHSAWKGYLNFGLDIGGYRGQNISKQGFIRYAQIGALLPLMENGGNGRHCPWLYDLETVDIYRKFVNLHLQLLPYFLTAAVQALSLSVSVIQPLAKKQGWIAFSDPSSFGYLLWKDILIFPVFNDQGFTQINFPKGSVWVYYFSHDKVFRDNYTVRVKVDLDEAAVFIRKGAVIPLSNRFILAYPSQKNYSRIIYNQKYTDYINYSSSKKQFGIKVDRYYRNSPTGDGSVRIQIIGAKQCKIDQKYSPRYRDNTLIFQLPLNTSFSIPDLVISESLLNIVADI